MKLAEALSMRADLQKRIEQMGPRLAASCRVQEGDLPPEDAKELFLELKECLAQWEGLVVKINKTNQITVLGDGQTLTAKIAARDGLKKRCQILQGLLDALMGRPDRYSRQEIKYVNTVNVSEIRQRLDECSKALRETDMEIQSANWTVDLAQ